jgi:hypothetical protein
MKTKSKKTFRLEDKTFFIDSRGMTDADRLHLSEIIAAHKAKKAGKQKNSKSKTIVRYDLLADDRHLSLVSEPVAKYKKTKKKISSKSARKSSKKPRK